VSWTRRFALAAGLGGLFFLVLSNGLGLLASSSTNLIVAAALMTLIGWYAVRVSAIGAAIALFLALFALSADQATIALGLPALPAETPDDYWLRSTLPAAAVWAAYPLLARALAMRLPRMLAGIAIGMALLPLPALRYFLEPGRLADVYLHPQPGNFAILPVPWLELVALATLLSAAAIAATARPRWQRFTRVVVPLLVVLTIAVPIAATASTEAQLRSGLEVSPNQGGPLTQITVRARMTTTDTTAALQWDGRPVTTGAFLEPLRPFTFGGVTRAAFLPAVTDAQAGTHLITLRAGDEQRQATFVLTPPSGLAITVSDGYVVISGGSPGAELTVLTIGSTGPERLTRTLDASGAWRSPLAPTDPSQLTIFAQSGDAWAALRGASSSTHQP
jgi:hypothetical protein